MDDISIDPTFILDFYAHDFSIIQVHRVHFRLDQSGSRQTIYAHPLLCSTISCNAMLQQCAALDICECIDDTLSMTLGVALDAMLEANHFDEMDFLRI